jgi:hypothetical protein
MQLVKFCKPEHNIHRGAKLRIGTLHEYRTIENPELQDEAEGKYEFTIDFPEEIELDRKWINLLFQGSIAFGNTDDNPRFPGEFSTHVEKLNLVRQNANSVVLKDTTVKIHRGIHDCLVFCMSLLPNVEAKLFDQYQDNWTFPEGKANTFAVRLAHLIMNQAKLANFDDSISASHSPNSIKNLLLNVRHRKVIYRERHLIITKHNMPSFDEMIETLLNIQFMKPPEPFSKEQEYRFVFELTDEQGRIFPPKAPILLTLNPLIEL